VKFTEAPLEGAYVIEIEPREDERGFFATCWSFNEAEKFNLITRFVENSISYNKKKGTLRGMHFQIAPHEQAKLVRCTNGVAYHVIIDLRKSSPTFKKWFGVELNSLNRHTLYIPMGFAHGFQTLKDDTEIFYQMSQFYAPECARGVRWDDPTFGIKWPTDERTILKRDLEYPNFTWK